MGDLSHPITRICKAWGSEIHVFVQGRSYYGETLATQGSHSKCSQQEEQCQAISGEEGRSDSPAIRRSLLLREAVLVFVSSVFFCK